MNARDYHDDILIDRLVDGELTPEERRQLLVELEAQTDGWRRCALAFIESQVWRTELQNFVEPAFDEQSCNGRDGSAPVKLRPDEKRGFTRIGRSSAAWLAAAAGLMLAFGLGRQVGVGERSQLGDVQIADSAGTSTPMDDGENSESLTEDWSGDAVTLVVNDQRGVPRRVRIPLVEGSELGAEFAQVPTWTSPELVRRLDQQGLSLAAQRRYAPLYFEQHNQRIPLVVPVDDAVVTPVSRPVY